LAWNRLSRTRLASYLVLRPLRSRGHANHKYGITRLRNLTILTKVSTTYVNLTIHHPFLLDTRWTPPMQNQREIGFPGHYLGKWMRVARVLTPNPMHIRRSSTPLQKCLVTSHKSEAPIGRCMLLSSYSGHSTVDIHIYNLKPTRLDSHVDERK
jgi:hypothetical protein